MCGYKITPLVYAVGVFFLAWSSPLRAQQQAPALPQGEPPADKAADDEALEEVLVTGSYLARSGFDGPSPVTVVSRDDIDKLGVPTITDILKNIPINTGSEFNFDRTNQAFTFGTAQFNLRGLGLGSTLTLLNGRRVTKSAAIANDGSQFVDVNALPLNMVKRIEVLQNGASALYGSDAVAGVVNIITRSDFRGFEIDGQYQTTTQASQEDYNVNVAFGAGNDTTHVTAFFTYFERSNLQLKDRDFIPPQGTINVTGQGMPGTFFPLNAAGTGPRPGPPGTPNTGPVPDPRCLQEGFGTGPIVGPGGATRAGIDNRIGGTSPLPGGVRGFCGFDFSSVFSIVPKEQRVVTFIEAAHEINNQFSLFAEFNFADNKAAANTSPSLPNRLPEKFVVVPANNPFIPAPGDPGFNPIFADGDGNPQAVGVQFRVLSLNDTPGQQITKNRMWRAMGGLRFDSGDNWTGEVSYQYSRSNSDFSRTQSTLTNQVRLAVAGMLPGLEGVFLNPFSSSIGPDGTTNDPRIIDAVIAAKQRFAVASLTTIEGHMAGDLPFELPGGAVGLAVGAQYRKDKLSVDNDDNANNGAFFFDRPEPDGSGSTEVWAIFAEARLPILPSLELQLAVRHENYDGGIGNTTDPKVALRWQVVDWLGVRGSFGTSFRAPNVAQTAIDQVGATRRQDPFKPGPGGLSCQVANGIVVGPRPVSTSFNLKSNPNLKPESADNFNLGVVVEPAEGLRLSVDYWRYNYSDVITLEDTQAILNNDCLGDGLPNDPRILRDGSGNVALVSVQYFNASAVRTDGLDFQASYGMSAGNMGHVSVGLNASYVMNFNIRLTQGAAVIKGAGQRNKTNPFRTVPQWRANVPVNWLMGAHSVNLTLRYIDSFRDDFSGQKVGNHTTLDAQYALNIGRWLGRNDNTTLSLGAINLFNNKVPKIASETFGFDSKIHDPRERLVYMRLKLTI